MNEHDAFDRLLRDFTPDPVERALLQIEADTALADVRRRSCPAIRWVEIQTTRILARVIFRALTCLAGGDLSPNLTLGGWTSRSCGGRPSTSAAHTIRWNIVPQHSEKEGLRR
jgi:hypothetical protein